MCGKMEEVVVALVRARAERERWGGGEEKEREQGRTLLNRFFGRFRILGEFLVLCVENPLRPQQGFGRLPGQRALARVEEGNRDAPLPVPFPHTLFDPMFSVRRGLE